MGICKNCRYFDENTRSGYKGYCTYYRSYEDPDEMAWGCTHYEAAQSSSSGGCYLTTACIRAKNLPDDCDELMTLRRFRDDHLATFPEGADDIQHYYEIAPTIVRTINQKMDAQDVWEKVYSEMVIKCVSMIQEGQYKEAYEHYKRYSCMLELDYCN